MVLLLSQTSRRLLLDTNTATESQLNTLCRQQQQEMRCPTFSAVLPVMTLWGNTL